MQMKRATGYAIRMTLELARKGKVTIGEMARMLDVEASYALKILRKMKKGGYVKAVHGKGGGYQLDREAGKISLWDIIESMEESSVMNRCMEKDHYCSMKATANCPVRKVYITIQKEIEKEMRSITIEKLKEEKRDEEDI